MVINGTKIWATGGLDMPPLMDWRQYNKVRGKCEVTAKFTEYIGAEGTSIGPELPSTLMFTNPADPSRKEPVVGHSVININETTSILTGGGAYKSSQKPYSTETYFFNHLTQKWTKGPNLNVETWQIWTF